MTLLEKIDYLLKKNNLNKRKLSIQADIPYSTIDSWYKVGYDNMKLSTFKKLCTFFDVDMTSMAYDELDIAPYDPKKIHTSPREREVIMNYRQADDIDRVLAERALHMDDAEPLKKGETA